MRNDENHESFRKQELKTSVMDVSGNVSKSDVRRKKERYASSFDEESPSLRINKQFGLSIEQVPLENVQHAFSLFPELTTPFSRPDILETISNIFERSLVTLEIKGSDGLKGVASLPTYNRGPFRIAPQLPIRYVGLVTDHQNIIDELILLRQGLRERRIVIAYCSFPPQIKLDLQKLRAAGFEADLRATYLLPLKGNTPEEILQVAHPRMRSSVRHALKELIISDATREETELKLCPLLDATYNRKVFNGAPYPNVMGSILWERHRNFDKMDPTVHIRSARIKSTGKVVGMMVAITHPLTEQTYSWAIARDPNYGNLQISGALIADMGAIATREGSVVLDLGGGTEGIKEFKSRMGAETAEYANIMIADRRYKFAQKAHEKWGWVKKKAHSIISGRKYRVPSK